MAARAEPLVGRAAELEALDGALSRAERHAFAAVEIARGISATARSQTDGGP